MWRHVALVENEISKEDIASIITVIRIIKLRTVLALTSNWSKLSGNINNKTITIYIVRTSSQHVSVAKVVPSSLILITPKMEAILSSETLVLIRATRLSIAETEFFIGTAVKTSNLIQHYPAWFCNGEVICYLWSTNWVLISQKTTFFIVTAVKTSGLT
jgi:hypothetical protein